MNTPGQQTFSILDFWQIVRKYRWYLILPVVIVPLAAILATFFIPPTYESSTTILIKETNVLPPTVQRGLQTGQTRRAESNTEILDPLASQIKSTKYIKSLIAKLNLPVSEKLKRSVAERAATMEDVSPAELAENLLVEYIREQINITMTGFNIITITVSSSSPVMARKMTQTIAEIFLEESLAQELAG